MVPNPVSRTGSLIVTVETITPETAAAYLKHNKVNRRIRPNRVNVLAGAMKRGEWMLTHQGIAFDSEGNIIDGQHRLLACVKSGVAFTVCVTRNLPNAAFSVMDQGDRRTHADALRADGRLVEVATYAAILHNSSMRNVTTAQIAPWVSLLADEHAALKEFCPTTAKYVSSTGMRLAAVLSVMDGGSRDYVHSVYRALVLADFDNLPPAGRSLMTQVVTGRVARGTGGAVREDGLARGWIVFNPAKANTRRVSVMSTAPSVEWAREVLEHILRKS
jgi:hypothetical protein